jgi:hypothetical protein
MLHALQRMAMAQALGQMFTPERHAGMTPDEDKMFGLCFNRTPVGGRAIDERWAAELDALLQAAKDKGKPCNLELNSTSGATPLVIAALSNGTARVRVLLKHGMRLAAAVWCHPALHPATATAM